MYILGRMGNAAQALRLIVERLGDIPQAIAFVQGQDDEDLWQLLISLALGSAATAGELMDNIGGHVNPLHLVRQLPAGMEIPGLRDRLVRNLSWDRQVARLKTLVHGSELGIRGCSPLAFSAASVPALLALFCAGKSCEQDYYNCMFLPCGNTSLSLALSSLNYGCLFKTRCASLRTSGRRRACGRAPTRSCTTTASCWHRSGRVLTIT